MAEKPEALQQKLSQYILYCKPGGIYQLLTKEEIEILEAEEKISTLSLKHKSKYTKKPYCLPIASENNEKAHLKLLKLIDKYLYFYNRTYKEKREKEHGEGNREIEKRLNLSKSKRESLLKIIRLLICELKIQDLDQRKLESEDDAKTSLESFILGRQKSENRYFGEDLSDNSDSEDEKVYLEHLSSPSAPTNIETEDYSKTASKQTNLFWLKTRLNTPKNEGLKKKITNISSQINQGFNAEEQLKKLPTIVTKTLNGALQERGKIEYNETNRVQVELLIGQINNTKDSKQLEKLLSQSKPIFVLGTRGINYMLDRWNADARRYHRRIDERKQPQFSEAVLKTLAYDYYTELDPSHDFHHNNQDHYSLLQEAFRLNQFLQELNETPPCINNSANHTTGNYLFNTVGDCLQDHFSNGVDAHLDDLAQKRLNSEYWQSHLKNSFNPGVAIGSRPYHALKYTFGLKDYYPRSMMPRYWNDGTIEYSHVGKVYLSLHPLEEILSKNGPNNISIQDRWARVSIGDQISPEKELSFLGFIPADRVFHQFVAKMPSFKGEYKNIYKFKYGLDKETYLAFQHLIRITKPESNERNQVINLLSEWLCAYHEVLLIEIAKEEALRRGGILAYVNRDGKLTLEPENGRIFTRGKSNLELRNEVHTLRTLRLELVKYLKKEKEDTNQIPGFTLIEFNNVINVLKNLLKNETFLEKIAEGITLTTAEEGLVFTGNTSRKSIQVKYGRKVANCFFQYNLHINSSFNSYKMQITNLANNDHLYTDLEINILLQHGLSNSPNVVFHAAHSPLIRGELEEGVRALFINELKRIFQSNQTAVMPIEISQDELDEDSYSNMVGIHWNGLIITPLDNNQFRIELIDPARSPINDINLTTLLIEQINATYGSVVARLFNLVQQAANESSVDFQMHLLKTEQQAGDLDCGAWTVDNLVRRVQNLPLRTRNDVNGNQLRQEHNDVMHRPTLQRR